MESAGKWQWQKQLAQAKLEEARSMASIGNLNEGSSSSKEKRKAVAPAAAEVTPQTIQFEGLNGTDCQKWWQETPDDHPVKASIRRAQVEWAIQMPIFCIRDYEGYLRTMIETYGRASRRSTFQYLGRNLVVSFKAADFTRVFGIPGQRGRKIQPKKIPKDGKLFLIRLVCGDLTEVEQAALAETSKGRGLKKTDIQEGPWRCLMDLVKSRLTGSSRASDITFPQVSMMNSIMTGKVYDWASVLAKRMHEFMTL